MGVRFRSDGEKVVHSSYSRGGFGPSVGGRREGRRWPQGDRLGQGELRRRALPDIAEGKRTCESFQGDSTGERRDRT